MDFSSFRGNEAAVRMLRSAAEGRRLGHAYLLCGAAGTGKKTLARIFAQALLCGGGPKPCGRCGACVKFLKGVHPDFTVVRKPADKTAILVDQIRALREELFIRPNEAEHRVALIEDAELMNPAAANALLKVLEEPPPYAVFLLTAKSRRAVPETIASRCIAAELFDVSKEEAAGWLRDRMPGAGEDELAEAVRYGDGNLGKSLRFLEEDSVRRGYEQALALAKALTARREYDVLEALAPFDGDREGLARLLSDFDGLLGRIASAPFSPGGDPEAEALARKIPPIWAAALHDVVGEVRQALQFNANCPLTAAFFGARLKTTLEAKTLQP